MGWTLKNYRSPPPALAMGSVKATDDVFGGDVYHYRSIRKLRRNRFFGLV